jgi:hypothetical protein
MHITRRRFLSASFAATVGLAAAPRAFAAPRLAEKPALLPQAMAALNTHNLKIAQRDVIGIADFSAHSSAMRLHLVNIASGRIDGSYLVAHGRGSDPGNSGWVQHFSNRPGSNASSEGSFLTGETYHGKHGRSGRLHGLDEENSLAFDRAIVIHSAQYVDHNMARRQGRIGRSLGCFTVEQNAIREVLDRLGPGRLLFASK